MRGVANFAPVIARYLAKKQGIENPEYAAILAELCGLLHDIRRDATEEVPHGPTGAEYIKNSEIKDLFLLNELEVICNIVYHHEDSYDKISQRFKDPLTRIIAQTIVIGDKLAEASGPRILERRSFFVGKERILRGDLRNKFKYPDDSYLAVLGETIRRLYDINHAKRYSKEMVPIVDFLHPWQYEFYKGLLLRSEMQEDEAAKYLNSKEFTGLDEALKRIDEKHLDGKYFSAEEFPQITTTILQQSANFFM